MSETMFPPNVFDRLLKDRIIWLGSEVRDALLILDWHGGQGSACYQCGSNWLSGKKVPADAVISFSSAGSEARFEVRETSTQPRSPKKRTLPSITPS